MVYIFVLSIISIFYTYFGYPILLAFIAQLRKLQPVIKGEISPFVSIVIPAYNEEKNIGAKLNEILNLDYPADKREIYVVSDASTDGTNELIQSFADRGIKLHRLEKRSGKIAAYKSVFPLLKGEVIIFSDATSILNPDSITNLVRNFADKSVGCVGGLLIYINPKQAAVGKGERKYWSYEKRVRNLESSLCSLPSVSGTFFGVRKELLPPDLKDDLAEDLIIPLYVKKKGLRTVYEWDAVCKDYTTLSVNEELGKRSRITVQNIRGLIDQADILNPFKYGLFSLIVFSHKLMRILVPVFLLLALASSLILAVNSCFFMLALLAQVFFYTGAWLGYHINQHVKFTLGNAMFYFCLSNFAILVGIVKWLRGSKVVTWETVRA